MTEHDRMKRWLGAWTGEARTWLDPSKAPTVGTWTGEVTSLLDGRFIDFTYRADLGGKPHEGRLTVAFEKDEGVWRTLWVDTFHTGSAVLVSVGAERERIAVTGSYFVAGHPRWGWRTELDDARDGELTLRMFNISPEGQEDLGVEVTLRRR